MLKSKMLLVFVAVLALAANVSFAEGMQGMDNMNKTQDKGSAGMQVHQGHGVVNKINASAGKINISHEAIPSMNWPGMTMDFKVQNKTDLAAIKPGMKVDFELTVQGKGYQITRITPAKE
ncbi:MAG: copper-binding protein [Gallionellaceae bacterium]